MKVLFHPPTGEVDLSGNADELHRLAALVTAGTGAHAAEDVGGYIAGELALTAVCVRVVPESAVLLSVDLSKRSLCIAGDLNRLEVLAANLREMAEMRDGGHLHADYFPGHPYLAPGSVALVVNSPHGGMPGH
jgi:hypothetical protein